MNSFGRIFRVQIFGESHGDGVGVVIDGCPAGLDIPVEDFLPDMERRKGGTQKGATPRKEDDIPIFRSGNFNGKTTGFPIMIFLRTKIPVAAIMKSSAAFPGRDMQILLPTKNLADLKITEAAGILAPG
ncbi:chorismate synthase [Niabella defluvii]|nr:chorismate synthase [Niabella sp. I65]